MAIVECSKCGLQGLSKCPYCRSVFGLGGMYLGSIEANLPFPDYVLEGDGAYLVVKKRWFPGDAPRKGGGIDGDELMRMAKPEPNRPFLQNEAWRLEGMRSLYELLKFMFEPSANLPDSETAIGRNGDPSKLAEYWNCNHDIRFAKGQTSDIGCGHGSKAE
jgi:hypothetical protein